MNYFKQFLMVFLLITAGVLTASSPNRGPLKITAYGNGAVAVDGNMEAPGYPGMGHTVYNTGERGVRIARTIYPQRNTAGRKITWTIVNNGPGIYRDVRFKYEGTNRNQNPGTRFVPFKSDGSTGTHGLKWNRDVLAPGDKWTVTAYERQITDGDVDVFTPGGQSGTPGQTLSFKFKIVNFQHTADTFELEAVTSRGWPTILPDGNVLKLDAASGGTVRVNVTIPHNADTGDELTLTAVSRSNPGIERSGTAAEIANTMDSGSITVMSPNGGELIEIDDPLDITWTAQGVGDLKISLWQNDTWVGLIADNINPAAGSYSWNVGHFINGGDDFDIGPFGIASGYKIKIKEKGETCCDHSDQPFSMYWSPPLLVLSPNGGESPALDSTMTIRWITDVSGQLKVSLWKEGVKVGNIQCNIQAGTDFCDWTVGELECGTPVLPGTGYKIKIKEVGQAVCDYSDGPFTITF